MFLQKEDNLISLKKKNSHFWVKLRYTDNFKVALRIRALGWVTDDPFQIFWRAK